MDDPSAYHQEGSRKRQRLSRDDSGPETQSGIPPASASASIFFPPNITTHAMSSANPAPDSALAMMQGSLDTMRQLLTCQVCHRLMYEPYVLTCGHTYCYSCLTNWIAENHKKTCPDCRSVINIQPSPSFVLREMVRLFSTRAELLGDGETSEEHVQSAAEEADIVCNDRLDEEGGGLFRGVFRKGLYMPVVPMYDSGDDIDRCPQCLWEVQDGFCEHCGIPVGDGLSDFDGEDLVTDEADYDSDDMVMNRNGDLSYPWGDEELEIREALFGIGRRARHRARSDVPPGNGSIESDSEEESDDAGSMDGFIAGDDEIDHEEGESDLSDDDEHDHEDIDEVDETDDPTATSQPSRRRGVPVVLSDDDDDDDDTADTSTTNAAQSKTAPNNVRSRPILLSSDSSSSGDDDHDDDVTVGEEGTSVAYDGFSSLEGDYEEDNMNDYGDGVDADATVIANHVFDGGNHSDEHYDDDDDDDDDDEDDTGSTTDEWNRQSE